MSSKKFKIIQGGKESKSATMLFVQACMNSNIPQVGHMLTSQMHKKLMPEVMDSNAGLCVAANHGNLGVVKLIIASDLFQNHHEKQYFLDEALFFAIHGEHMNVIKYLTSSVQLSSKASIEFMDKKGFWMAAERDQI